MEKTLQELLKLYVVDMDFLSIYARRALIEMLPKVKRSDGDSNLQRANKSFRNRPEVQV
jgi:hypothetical protein